MISKKAIAIFLLILLSFITILVRVGEEPYDPFDVFSRRSVNSSIEWEKVSFSKDTGILELEGKSKKGEVRSVIISTGRAKTLQFWNEYGEVQPMDSTRLASTIAYIFPPEDITYRNEFDSSSTPRPTSWNTTSDGQFSIKVNLSQAVLGYRERRIFFAELYATNASLNQGYVFYWS